jgi:hypothetical protein
MHAISRDAATGAVPCIFAQVERPAAPPGVNGDGGDDETGHGDGGEEEEELLSCTELRLVPKDEAARACPPRGTRSACASPCLRACTVLTRRAFTSPCAVNSLFRTMCDVAALNPDSREEGTRNASGLCTTRLWIMS